MTNSNLSNILYGEITINFRQLYIKMPAQFLLRTVQASMLYSYLLFIQLWERSLVRGIQEGVCNGSQKTNSYKKQP